MRNPTIISAEIAAAAFVLAAVAVPLGRRLALRHGITDQPRPGHPHEHVAAKLGGIAIIAAFLVPLLVVGMIPVWLTVCTVAMAALGIADDLWTLTPKSKLAVQLVITAVFAFTEREFSSGLYPWLVASVTVFWLIATTNAFNLIDGLDGLASGIGIIVCTGIAATAMSYGDHGLVGRAIALGAALLGFLLYNFYPASVFMGDAGALPIGFLLGVLSLQAAAIAKNSAIAGYVFPIFVMLVPLLDAAVVTSTRLATGHSIMTRGLDHCHHRLLSLGLPTISVDVLTWVVAAITAMYAVATSLMPHAYLIATLPMICVALAPYVLFLMDLTFEAKSPGQTYGSSRKLARLALKVAYRFRLIDLLLDCALISASYLTVSFLWLNFRITDDALRHLVKGLPWVLLASCAAFFIAGVYRGMWRYVGLSDIVRFSIGAGLAGTLLAVTATFGIVSMSPAAAFLFAALLFDLLIATRVSFRLMRKAVLRAANTEHRVLIVGAGETGAALTGDRAWTQGAGVVLVGFIDDDGFKRGRLINGVPVLGTIAETPRIYASRRFEEIVIATSHLDNSSMDLLSEFAKSNNVRLRRYSVEMSVLVPGVENAPSQTRYRGEAIAGRKPIVKVAESEGRRPVLARAATRVRD